MKVYDHTCIIVRRYKCKQIPCVQQSLYQNHLPCWGDNDTPRHWSLALPSPLSSTLSTINASKYLCTPVTILKYYSLFSLHCPTHVRQTRIAKDKTWCKGIEEFWSWLNHQERWPPYKVWELSSLYYPVVGVVCSRVISLFRLLPSNNWSFINLWSPVFIWIFLKFNLNQEQTGQNVAHHSRRFLLGMIFSYCIFCWRIMQGCLQSDLV